MPRGHIHDILSRAREVTDSVIVALSTGKDSQCVLQVCVENFAHVSAFFMYTVPGLSFHERVLAFVKRRYGIEALRVPHWGLARMLKTGSMRLPNAENAKLPLLKQRDVERYVRGKLGMGWIAYGHKKYESIERTGLITSCQGVDAKHKRIYPIGDWSNGFVLRYLKRHKIPLSAEYALFHSSYDGGQLDGESLWALREHMPDDYAKIVARFPDAEAEVWRWERYGAAAVRPKEVRPVKEK